MDTLVPAKEWFFSTSPYTRGVQLMPYGVHAVCEWLTCGLQAATQSSMVLFLHLQQQPGSWGHPCPQLLHAPTIGDGTVQHGTAHGTGSPESPCGVVSQGSPQGAEGEVGAVPICMWNASLYMSCAAQRETPFCVHTSGTEPKEPWPLLVLFHQVCDPWDTRPLWS